MMGFRDALRREARKPSKKSTVIERTGIEDRRRRLESRIKAFHRKADTLMDIEDLEDLPPLDEDVEDGEREVLEEWAGINPSSVVEDEDVAEEYEESSAASSHEENIGSDVESDEEDPVAYPEKMALSLPSRLGRDYISRHGLETLGKQEIELRVGQANDSLAALRVELGHKSLLLEARFGTARTRKERRGHGRK